ncbi:MAG: AzlC family ABC transporter permease [Oscillibacter sp.]|nr:AzlC family ABC transporter permease [Oscillibacter sp.]
MRDGVPIGLGYLAVSFSLGIAARNAGLTAFQGFVLSFLGMASAGEYAAITVIAAGAPYLEMAAVTVIANARYLLMSFALSQRMAPDLSLGHRLAIGYSVTDELFAIAAAQPVPLNPWYSYGSYLVAIPSWAAGTAVGVAAGNLLPARLVSALSVALFGMFLAVIIPPARRDRVVLGAVLAGFACSYAASRLLPGLSGGTRTILLTLLLAGLAAAAFPVPDEDAGETDTEGDREAETDRIADAEPGGEMGKRADKPEAGKKDTAEGERSGGYGT